MIIPTPDAPQTSPPARSPAIAAPGAWRPRHWVVAAAISLLSLSLGWQSRAPDVSVWGDEATYVILSHSLEQGHYRDEFLAGAPPHAKYPPGTPAWIWMLRHVAGPDLDVVRAANLLLLVLAGLLAGDAVRRLVGPWPGVATIAAIGVNPTLLYWSGTALSEALFIFLAALSLWATLVSGERAAPWALLASVASLGSFLVRTIGFTTVLGVAVWLALRNRWRLLALHLLASLAMIGGWAWYAFGVATTAAGSSYARDLERVGSTGPGNSEGLAAQVWHNAVEYLGRIVPRSFGLPYVEGTGLDNAVWLLAIGATAAVGFIGLARRWPAMLTYTGASCAVLLIWPWPIHRLVVPLLPFIAAAALSGTATLAARLPRRGRTLVLGFVTSTLVVGALHTSLNRVWRSTCQRDSPYTESGCFELRARGFVAAARFAKDSLPPRAIIATSIPATVYYFGERLTAPISVFAPGASLQGAPNPNRPPADYVLLGTADPAMDPAGRRLLLPHCDRWRVRARFDANTFVLEPAGSEPGDACAALGAPPEEGMEPADPGAGTGVIPNGVPSDRATPGVALRWGWGATTSSVAMAQHVPHGLR